MVAPGSRMCIGLCDGHSPHFVQQRMNSIHHAAVRGDTLGAVGATRSGDRRSDPMGRHRCPLSAKNHPITANLRSPPTSRPWGTKTHAPSYRDDGMAAQTGDEGEWRPLGFQADQERLIAFLAGRKSLTPREHPATPRIPRSSSHRLTKVSGPPASVHSPSGADHWMSPSPSFFLLARIAARTSSRSFPAGSVAAHCSAASGS